MPSRWSSCERSCLGMITGSMHCIDIKGECRRAACSTAVYSVPTPAAAEADSSAFLMKLIFEKLEEMSRKKDRLEESLQRKGSWRWRKDVRCHRCQHPGHIAKHCRAQAPDRREDVKPLSWQVLLMRAIPGNRQCLLSQ